MQPQYNHGQARSVNHFNNSNYDAMSEEMRGKSAEHGGGIPNQTINIVGQSDEQLKTPANHKIHIGNHH